MNKYIITGSLGHISKQLVKGLVKAGKEVSVITSTNDRVQDIDKLGAKALVGQVNDKNFLNAAFKGAEVVYTMIPPLWQTTNWRQSQLEVAHAYAGALKENKVPYVVNLSSVGAHVGEGMGPVNALHDFEELLNGLPHLNVKHLRPAYFYYNFLSQIDLIKNVGIMGGNFGKEKILLVDPQDIASAALEELMSLNFSGNSVRYVISDDRTGQEIADVLGKAIGKQLSWVVFSDEEQLAGLLQAGVPETHARAFTEMGHSNADGSMEAHVRQHFPLLSPSKLDDYVPLFEQAFNGIAVTV